jgi:methylglutaconyl-CoA hydratase
MDDLSFIAALESGVDVSVIARQTEECKKGIARFLKKE